MDPEKVVVGEVLRTRGIRGELVVRSQTDVPDRFKQLTGGQVRLVDGSNVLVEIAAAWKHKGDWVLKFTGVDSIEAAERFRGGDLWVPQESRGSLGEGDFFRSDLIGCKVIDQVTGVVVGTVEGWQKYGGPPLMEVRGADREHLIPFVGPLCAVDLADRTIRLDLPQGLLDL